MGKKIKFQSIYQILENIKSRRLVNICVCKYEVDDFVDNLPSILMTTIPMTDEVGGNNFITLWWWWLTWTHLKPH